MARAHSRESGMAPAWAWQYAAAFSTCTAGAWRSTVQPVRERGWSWSIRRRAWRHPPSPSPRARSPRRADPLAVGRLRIRRRAERDAVASQQRTDLRGAVIERTEQAQQIGFVRLPRHDG